MYAFREPFTAATFNGLIFLGVHYKNWLITSHISGYTLSKFIGIKIVPEMRAKKRAVSILIVIGVALFERLIATFKYISNIGFLFYFADALGYLGSVFTFLLKNSLSPNLGWLNFFYSITNSFPFVGIGLCTVALATIKKKHKKISHIEYA